MAQRVEVYEECDRHLLTNGKSVEGTTAIIGFNGAWYAIEACKTHTAKEIDPIQALVEELGRKLEGGPRELNRLMKLAKEGVPAGTVPAGTVTQFPTATPEPAALRSVQPAETAKLAASNGKATRKTSPSRGNSNGRYICLWCEHAPYTTSTGLTLHHKDQHGLPTSMVELFGLICPLCGSDGSPKLGLHLMGRKHKNITVPQAFAKALASGDKHGVATPVFNKAERIPA